MTRSVNGTDHLKVVVWYLAFSEEPLSIYRLSKLTGLPTSTVKYILDRLFDKGHVLKTEDGGYIMNPRFVQVYEDAVLYRVDDKNVMLITPSIENAEQLKEFVRHLPSHLKLWILVDGSLE